MSEPTAKIETVTPEVAKKMLVTNSNNRNMSERSLNHYIRQIEEGQWEFNGDTIRFAADGTLLDGQHRLQAIIQTKKPLKCLVVRGLKKSVMATIDTGKGRTVADHLKLQNRFSVGSYTATAAAISIIFRFRKGKYVESHERMTPAEAIAFIEQNPGILKSAQLINNRALCKMTTPSIAIACHYLFTKVDKFKAEEFFDRLTTGENLGKSSPILKLRTILHSMRSATERRGVLHQRTFLYYICAAFEAYIAGRRIDGFERFSAQSVIEMPKRGGGGEEGSCMRRDLIEKFKRLERMNTILKWTMIPGYIAANLASEQVLMNGYVGWALMFLGFGFINIYLAYQAYKARREALNIWKKLNQ